MRTTTRAAYALLRARHAHCLCTARARLSELSARSVREKLTRLTQMSTLLNLERVAELAELWSDGGWRFSAAEARQVLALRVDFRRDAIAQLVLD